MTSEEAITLLFEAGLSQNTIAKSIDAQHQTISRYRDGTMKMRLRIATRIFFMFDIIITDIVENGTGKRIT